MSINPKQTPEPAAEIFDVAVIGYGPTGLVAASLLGEAGYKVVVIERWPTPYGLPRLTHIDGETARIVQACGDVDQALRDACGLGPYQYRNADDELLIELDWTGHACGFPAHISIYQPDIEDAIHQRAASFPGVEILRGWEAETLRQDEDGVRISAHLWRGAQDSQWTTPSREFIAKYVIGADGANSFVRRSLCIERDDFGQNERWLNLDSENKRDLGEKFSLTTIYCDPARAHMYMPIGTRRTRFELRVLPGEDTAYWEDEAVGWRWLKEQHGLGPEDMRLLRHVVYTFETRMAHRWRDGRIFLAGDAAHTMMPYMGQGACSGMRDGINLAWKLDLVLSGRSAPGLLDTYEEERRPHVSKIMEMARFLGKVANEDDPQKVAERDAAFRARSIPPMPPFPRLEAGIVHAEVGGSLLPAIGTPAPQGRVRKGEVEGRLDDVVGHGFLLIALDDPLRYLDEGQLGFLEQLGCHIVVLSDAASIPGAVVELNGAQAAFMRAHGMQAYISRPDFAVFGGVSDLAHLPGLVDSLRQKLHWRGAAQSSMLAGTSAAAVS
ncbi:3-(3-hydroxyphenyl)propionate hydroxylase [Cupriavidus sp. GA3-3]|uniref:bifunctional 3-(3-hydroxy-phenyl)propionate/3-hydroxycinnamic acid hydroxylase MhpA n=1 Tax=Cupriavidus sp. GA3-3 TaxID=1229514 RepID=UPI00032F1F1D|nr:bifunctional 3-(3-hydroxy-phenyl)propionate/3-hydroxycinnamic acid hydroxylase [Cupriavidus sp. GA3-3]EON21067.1 3-(3-hydroxyphenyl)propionate hydroxylase [Cupriavidus sp. GA3-3]